MKKLVQEKQKAIDLRKKGFSYNEILQRVSVAKSTLSLWLKDIPLTKKEKQVLRNRKNANISRGRIKAASVLRGRRLDRERRVVSNAMGLFEKYVQEPLFHAGITMYWAEGSKTDTRWMLINTDPDVIAMMRTWLQKYSKVTDADIMFRLYIHRPYADGRCEQWWQRRLGVPPDRFLKTVFKPTAHKSKKKGGHKGCLRIEVNRSKDLLLTMKVFKNLAVEYYQKQ